MKAPDLVALASFALAGLLVLRPGLKRVVLLLVSIGMLALLFSILSHLERTPRSQVHRENEVPAKQMPSREEMGKILKEISDSGRADWSKTYPHGYIIFGQAAEGIMYEDQLHDAGVDMDFGFVEVAVDHTRQIILVRLPNIVISYRDGTQPLEYAGNLERFRFVVRQPVQSMSSEKVFFEVLDTDRKIFLMGLK